METIIVYYDVLKVEGKQVSVYYLLFHIWLNLGMSLQIPLAIKTDSTWRLYIVYDNYYVFLK